MNPEALFARAEAAFTAALAGSGGLGRDILLAGVHVRLSFAGTAFQEDLERALAGTAFDGDKRSKPSLTVRLWDGHSTGSPIRSESWQGVMLGPAGVIGELSSDRYHVSLDVHASLMTALDSTRHVAYHYARDARLLPPWEMTHPARLLWAAWARSRGQQLCHAAVVADGGRGILLCGPSGSGKSTVTLACLREGLASAGDDYVLVEPALDSDAQPFAHALYRSISLEESHARAFPGLLPAPDATYDMTPERRKTVLYATGERAYKVGGSYPLVAVVVPVVDGAGESKWQPISPAVALRALAPSTMGQLGAFGADAFRSMAALCRSLPCFQLRLGTDIRTVPGLVRELIAEAMPAAAVSGAAR